jgi:SCY1-like protein 2
MLAVATSFFARTAISQSYIIGGPSQSSRPSTPGTASGSGASLTAPTPFTPSFPVGLWKVQSAQHKVTSKRVSIWTFDKRGADMERLGPAAKERTIEVLKSEVHFKQNLSLATDSQSLLQASALGRLRHPSILGDTYLGNN